MTVTSNKCSAKATPTSVTTAASGHTPLVRPKSVYQWSILDVEKWFRKNFDDIYHLYWEKFLEQDITGRSLIRLGENSLLRLGIVHPEHRQAVWGEIARLRLKYGIVQLKDLERGQEASEAAVQ